MLVLGLTGVVVGILNSYDHFTIPALAPIAWNLVILLGLGLGVENSDLKSTRLYYYAVAILVATVVQFLLPFAVAARPGRPAAHGDRHPRSRREAGVRADAAGDARPRADQLNALIDQLFATTSSIPYLAPAAIVRAFRLYMLPQGIFSVAVATVLFPLLSRHAAREDWEAFKSTVATGLRLISFLLLPASAAAAILATPIVRLLYQHGKFTASSDAHRRAVPRGVRPRPDVQRDDAHAQPRLLLPAVAVDPDHRRGDEPRDQRGSRRGVLPLRDLGDPALDLAREHRRDVGAARALPAARRRLRDEGRRRESFVLVGVASAVLAAVAWWVWHLLDSAFGQSLPAQVVSLGGGLLLGYAAFFGACRLLGVRELETLSRLRRRTA